MIRPLLASLVLLCPAALNAQEAGASADALPSIVAPARVDLHECDGRVMIVYVVVFVRAARDDDWMLATRPTTPPDVGPGLLRPTRELGEQVE